ncbi:MAG TPA: exosortase-associated EpsI family protein [Thermoguttaceae bacterium]|nr:exosortase-associated EpsI family protein [Thermoguttaceae bacterium]
MKMPETRPAASWIARMPWRLLTVVALVFAVHLVLVWTRHGLKPDVENLGWSLSEVPYRLGKWEGAEATLDERTFQWIGGMEAVNREYRHPATRSVVAFHAVLYELYDKAANHNPTMCYRAGGYRERESDLLPLSASDPTALANRSVYEREGRQVVEVHWYQFGDYIVRNRWQMGKVRLKLMGGEAWPPVIKVLLQIDVKNVEQDKATIAEFAEVVYEAVNRLDNPPQEETPDPQLSEASEQPNR